MKLPYRFKLSSIVLVAAGLILAGNLGQAVVEYARYAGRALQFPYPLEYGEGVILDQALRLAGGEAIYRTTIATPPFTVTNTPPLYDLLLAPLTHLFGPAYWYGRGISVLCLVLTALALGLTLHHLTHNWLAAAAGGLLVFAIPYLFYWSLLTEVDTLALALSWAALYALVRWPERRAALAAAGLLMTAAIYTRQTFALAAPLAALAWLWGARGRRTAAAWLAGVAGASLALFLATNALTRGGFYLNLVTYNANRWSYPQVMGALIEFSLNGFILVLIAIMFFILERLDSPTRTWPLALPYTLGAILITLLVGKTGASEGGMLELSAAFCLASGAAIAWIKNDWVKAALLVLLAVQVGSLNHWTASEYQVKFDEKFDAQPDIAQLASIVSQSSQPVLVDEFIGLLPLEGKRIYYQPFEFSQLTQAGLWNPAPLIASLAAHQFSALLIYFPSDVQVTQSRWPAAVYAACWNNYDNTANLASTLVLFPKK